MIKFKYKYPYTSLRNTYLGYKMVRQEIVEVKKLLKDSTALEIFFIFFEGWHTLEEASKIYDPNLPKKVRYNRRVTYYFYKFKKLGWIEEENIKKIVPRKTAKGKDSMYPSKSKRYHLNYNFFFTDKRNESKLKEFLIYFLNRVTVKSYLKESYKNDIPLGIEDIIKQLFTIAISLKVSKAKPKLKKKDKDFLNISKITIENYENIIKEKTNKYYGEVMFTKSKKISPKLIKRILPKTCFWNFLNLFAVIMIKLFFNKEFANNLVRTSPELYFWLRNMHEDFSFVF